MRVAALLFSSSALLLNLGEAVPRGGRGGGGGGGGGNAVSAASGVAVGSLLTSSSSNRPWGSTGGANEGEKLYCSANQSGAVPDWAANPAWAANMTACLQQMNNAGWNGAECKPALADGTALGPSFGFYKGEEHYDDGQDCYNQCAGCLKQGIDWKQAQTTVCKYSLPHKVTCDMGFDYGK